MISPITVGLVAGTGVLVALLTGNWVAAVAAGLVVWGLRVWLATRVARRIAGLEARIDPFALREPWRFFVRDALSAQKRLADAIERAGSGPLRDRLDEIGADVVRSVEQSWEVARRGQQLTDTRRAIDLAALDRAMAAHPPGDPRHDAARAQRESHDRIRAREEHTRERLEILEAQLDRAVVGAAELATRSGRTEDAEQLADDVADVVEELDSLRIALDEIGESG